MFTAVMFNCPYTSPLHLCDRYRTLGCHRRVTGPITYCVDTVIFLFPSKIFQLMSDSAPGNMIQFIRCHTAPPGATKEYNFGCLQPQTDKQTFRSTTVLKIGCCSCCAGCTHHWWITQRNAFFHPLHYRSVIKSQKISEEQK